MKKLSKPGAWETIGKKSYRTDKTIKEEVTAER